MAKELEGKGKELVEILARECVDLMDREWVDLMGKELVQVGLMVKEHSPRE